jgi:cation diffusion facilitator CzcD-associated flavoprotein CzcO
MGYFLARQGLRFVILDRAESIAAAWRQRWDSLKLFTPRRYNSLPGLAFPGVTDAPGLYFLGLTWQHTRGSALIGWVKDDAEFISRQIDDGPAPRAATTLDELPAAHAAGAMEGV